MINNPLKVFMANGNGQLAFTYEGGSMLYNWQPKECGLASSMHYNMMFMADSEEHAKDVVRRALTWYRDNSRKDRDAWRIKCCDLYLSNIDKWVIKEISNTQIFNVSWAENDNF